MVKTGKDGKNKQNKKQNAIPIPAFDLDSIGLDDLKIYIKKLEKELAMMRKDCAFYGVNKEKIMNFLMNIRNCYVTQKQASVVENAYFDDLIEQLRRFPESYNEKAVLNEKEKNRKKLEKLFNDFLEISSAEAKHLDEEYSLKQQISEIDKCLQRNRYYYETTMIDGKELFRNAQVELDNECGKMLESSLKQYVHESLKSYRNFNADKIKLLISVWSFKEHPAEVRESFLNEIKDMQDFFYEITSNNNEVVKMLRDKLEYLLIEEKKLKINLKGTLLENAKLQEVETSDFYNTDISKSLVEYPSDKKNAEIERKFENLQFQNEMLKAHLRHARENWENLKKQFVSAIRKTYQKADMRAYILGEIIKRKMEMVSMDSEKEEPEPVLTDIQVEEKVDDEDGAINIFSMKVEDSDTLFVPPLYYKFWDPIQKRYRDK